MLYIYVKDLYMKFVIQKIFVAGLFFTSLLATAQTKEPNLLPEASPDNEVAFAAEEVANFRLAFDYIRLVKNYHQLEKLLAVMPAESLHWNFIPSIFPLVGTYGVSSGYGYRTHPTTGKYSFHNGIDLPAAVGTGVYATASGVVEKVVTNGGSLGHYIVIDHLNGFKTFYGHLSRFHIVPGQSVAKGQLIGAVGLSGRTTGPHLHYIIQKETIKINPFQFCFITAKLKKGIAKSQLKATALPLSSAPKKETAIDTTVTASPPGNHFFGENN